MTIRAKLKKPTPTLSSDGVGSVVLKGFSVPSGFVLHYRTSLGDDRSAKEGEYVNTSNKFQDIRDGKVSGWSIQKVQSSGFDFGMQEEEDNPVQFEDHTFTPWGDKITVLGVPVLSDTVLRRMNLIQRLGGLSAKKTNPEITQYISEIRKFLEDTYKVKPALSEEDVLDTLQTINSNINLLLSLEKTPYIKNLFDVNTTPDVTSKNLPNQLNPKNAEKINLDYLSPELLKDTCAFTGVTPEEFVQEVSGGLTRVKFEEKYGEYIRVNSVKVNDMLITKDEAKDIIQEAIQSIPDEVRPIVLTYLGGQDLITQSLDEVIESLKDSEFLFTEKMSGDDLESLQPKDDLDTYDLRKVQVDGYDFISGRFEILRRVLSPQTLLKLKDEDGADSQSVRDTISEIIENYISYLGGDVYIYKTLMRDWLSGNYYSTNLKTVYAWAEGKNTPEVREMRPTIQAIQSAHSAIYETISSGQVYRPFQTTLEKDILDITELSIEVTSPLVSFTFDKAKAVKGMEGETVLLSAKVPANKVLFMPGLYMPQPYWRKIKGKPVYVNRGSVPVDENAEVVIKASSIIITKYSSDEYTELEVVV